MENWLLAILIKPIALFVLLVAIPLPVRLAVQKWMKPGKMKNFLLR